MESHPVPRGCARAGPKSGSPASARYVQMVPSAAVLRNSREVPIALLLPSCPPVTGFLARYRGQSVYQFDTCPSVPQHDLARASANGAYQQVTGDNPRFAVSSEIIGLNVKHLNREATNDLASQATAPPRKRPVIHSRS